MIKRILLALALLIGAPAIAGAATPWPLGVFPPTTAYSGGYSTVQTFESQMGVSFVPVENFYVDFTQAPGTGGANWLSSSDYNMGGFDSYSENGGPNSSANPWLPGSGVIPMGDIPMVTTNSAGPSYETVLQNYTAGAYDAELQGMVQHWYNAGYHTQYWRPGVEMNEYSSNSAYTCATDTTCLGYWRAAFQHIYTTMHAEASAIGASVQIVWNPGADAGGTISPIAANSYWPGAAYVDVLGMDFYGNAYEDNSNNTCPNYTNVSANLTCDPGSNSGSTALGFLAAIQFALANNKPIGFPEFGSGGNSDGPGGDGDNPLFPAWVADILKGSSVHVSFVSIWDDNGGCTCAFTPAGSAGKPNEAAAFTANFGAGAPGGTITPSANNTQINGPINFITDTNGNQWSISLNQTLLENGVQDTSYTLNPYVIFWSGSVLSVESSTGIWQTINLSTGAPTTASAPSGFVAPHAASATNTTINGTTGGIYDVYGNYYTITSGGQIAINGTVVGSSGGVVTLFWGGALPVDQLNNLGSWYTQPPDGSGGVSIVTPTGYGNTTLPITATPTVSNVAIVDPASAHPFTGASVTDPNAAQTETLRVTQTGTGVLSDASAPGDGATITGGNAVSASGTAAQIGTILNNLLFTPAVNNTPGLQITTTVVATVTDTLGQTVSLTSTLAATAPTVQAIIVTPAATVLSSTGTALVHPFSSVVISDANTGQNETATISISPSNGTLVDPNAGTDGSTNISNVITITSSSATTLANDIDAITFTPSASGTALSTIVTASVRDTAGSVSAITSTIATASAAPSAAPGCLQTSVGCPSPAYNSLALGGHLTFFGAAPTSSNGTIQPNSADASGAIYEGSNQTSVTIHFNNTPAFVSAHCQIDSPNNAQFTTYTDPVTSTLTINHASASGDQWVWKCN